MEARCQRSICAMALAVVAYSLGPVAGPSLALAAGYRTTNFVVSAPTPALAKEIGDTAEVWRQKLSIEWLGEEMPPWSKLCPINARVEPNLGAGGATSFVFDRGEVFNWDMKIQGSRERVLDSVLPHEITHTIFASYFRQPLPRWADEGACTTVEHRSEISKQERMLIDFLKTGRGIPFSTMFAMKDYPQDVMPLYSQGHSLAQWLIEQHGKKAFLAFISDGLEDENWPRAVQKHYGFHDLYALQNSWLDWVKQGRPQLAPVGGAIASLASHEEPIVRGQSPDDDVTPIGVASAAALSRERPPAGNSIYAAMAARAKVQARPATTASAARSIYDASLSSGTVRR
ncbi:MAG: hypothetical protein WD971_06310 [Pirellulales bacterium]